MKQSSKCVQSKNERTPHTTQYNTEEGVETDGSEGRG
jgi:hypothetical protein